tara:strand:+ start:174 stop:605 length:432 start_codon:yes stop_codon:yes gene_type:complete
LTDCLLPESGRLAGIDYGTVRIGIAICDAERILATPHENYTRRNEMEDAQFFKDLIASESLVGFVIGLPLHTDGNESQKSQETRSFASWLFQETGLPFEFQDERFSTKAAHELMIGGNIKASKRKKRLDAVAAQVILSSYIER